MEQRYLMISTTEGNIYAKEVYEESDDSFFKKNSRLYDIDTQEPFEMIDNYIKFTNLDKCLQYANTYVEEDESVYFGPYNLRTVREEEIKARELNATKEGYSLMDETYKIIQKGVSEKEAKEKLSKIVNGYLDEIKQKKEEELKKIQEEKEKYGWFITFYNTFGDLFEEEENKYKYNR